MEMPSAAEQNTSAAEKKTSAVVKWAFILGIAIVANLFVSYAVMMLYVAPEYTNFCPEKQVNKIIESESACLEVGGQWNEGSVGVKGEAMSTPYPAGSYCNKEFTCSKEFQEADILYSRNVFLIFVVMGILLLVGSTLLRGAPAVSLGLSFAGVLALFIGSMRYWGYMNGVLQVIILGLALAALITVAYRKFRD